MMRNGWIFQFMASALFATGCAGTDAPESSGNASGCEPTMAYDCACPGGVQGSQMCNDTGTALSPCDCGTPAGTGGSTPIAGAGSGGVSGFTGTGGTNQTGTGGTIQTGSGGTIQTGTGGTIQTGTGGTIQTGTGGTIQEGTGGTIQGGSGGTVLTGGACCADGNCLCHGPDPTGLTSATGPFATTQYTGSTGTIYYPTDADPPFAGVALCGGFLNTGPEMAAWGPFYASYGIVTVITTTTGADLPDVRGTKLLASIDELKAENANASSPLYGQMAGRYGTSGYSMGGGGTTLATATDKTLNTSVGLAPWAPNGTGVQTPTLLLCGDADTVAPCGSNAQVAYGQIPESTPKMMMVIPGATHFNWFDPKDAGGGMSGETALAFQKVYLEGDERWKPILLQSRGTVTTNIH